MKIRIAMAALVILTLSAVSPEAQASARKPFHCHYDYTGRTWYTLWTPEYTLHCDRVWR